MCSMLMYDFILTIGVQLILTCSHHFINGYAGGIQLLCKLMHGLAWVLICVGVYVGLNTWQTHWSRKEQLTWSLKNCHLVKKYSGGFNIKSSECRDLIKTGGKKSDRSLPTFKMM